MNERLIQPEPGCSDPTFVGSTADVTLLASAGLNLASREFDRLDVPCGIAFTPALDGAKGPEPSSRPSEPTSPSCESVDIVSE